MEFQRPAGARLASLQDGLRPGDEVVQSRETGRNRRKLHRLLNAPEELELALAPAEEPLVGWRSAFGPKFHGLAHDLRAGRKSSQPFGENLMRLKPATRSPHREGREQARLLGQPHDEVPGLDRPETLLGKVFLGFVTTHPDMAADGNAAVVQWEREDRKGARALGVQEGRGATAEVSQSGLVPAVRLSFGRPDVPY
jgi:hypothetical protein